MKKSVVMVVAFLALFGFCITGAIAQTWTWDNAYEFTPDTVYEFIGINATDNSLEGSIDGNSWETITLGLPVDSLVQFTDQTIDPTYLSATGPNGIEYVIDSNTVGFLLPDDTDPTAFDQLDQPIIPTTDGSFIALAVGNDGKLYLLFETTTEPITQYILKGTPPTATVRFTPRSLNLGSNGNWVTCKISDLPGNYKSKDIALESLCIIAINDEVLLEADRICRDTEGPYNQSSKLMVKFIREDLAGLIIANDPNSRSAKITMAGHSQDGQLQFYGEDTIKTKPVKQKKDKKDK